MVVPRLRGKKLHIFSPILDSKSPFCRFLCQAPPLRNFHFSNKCVFVFVVFRSKCLVRVFQSLSHGGSRYTLGCCNSPASFGQVCISHSRKTIGLSTHRVGDHASLSAIRLCLPVCCLSAPLACLPAFLPACPSRPACLPACVPACLSACPADLLACLSADLPAHAWLPACLLVCLFACLSVCMVASLPLCLSGLLTECQACCASVCLLCGSSSVFGWLFGSLTRVPFFELRLFMYIRMVLLCFGV